MPRKSAPKPDDSAQAKRFVAMAKQLEVDESDGASEKALKKVVRPTPQPKSRAG